MHLPPSILLFLLPLLTHSSPLPSNTPNNNLPYDPLPPSPYIPAVAQQSTTTSISASTYNPPQPTGAPTSIRIVEVPPSPLSASSTAPQPTGVVIQTSPGPFDNDDNLDLDDGAGLDPSDPLNPNPNSDQVGSLIRPSNSTLPPSAQAVSYAKSTKAGGAGTQLANLGGRKERRTTTSDPASGDQQSDSGSGSTTVGSSIPYSDDLDNAGDGVGEKAMGDFKADYADSSAVGNGGGFQRRDGALVNLGVVRMK